MSPLADQISSVRTIRVTRGLFVLRYVSSKAGLNAPTVSVATPPGSAVDVICPDEARPQLVSPGDGVVVRAARDAFLNISVRPSHINGSCDAELVLERVSTTIRRDDAPGPGDAEDEAPSAHGVELLAHVARRGDVVVAAGEWICGPDLPMAIEGIEIRWRNKPRDVDIVAAATVNARGLRRLPEQTVGSFAGTRGKAAPITALTLSLKGRAASDFSLSCDALFLGMPVTSVRGRSCALSGPTGWEPLVGLRLSVSSAIDRTAREALGLVHARASGGERAILPQAARLSTDGASRVRIFRGSRSPSAPTPVFSK